MTQLPFLFKLEIQHFCEWQSPLARRVTHFPPNEKKKEFKIKGTVWCKAALSKLRRKVRAGRTKKDKEHNQTERDTDLEQKVVSCKGHRVFAALPLKTGVLPLFPEPQVTSTCFHQQNRWEWCCTSSKTSPAGLARSCSYPPGTCHYVETPSLWEAPGEEPSYASWDLRYVMRPH